jgi:hypothetical protein
MPEFVVGPPVQRPGGIRFQDASLTRDARIAAAIAAGRIEPRVDFGTPTGTPAGASGQQATTAATSPVPAAPVVLPMWTADP